MTLLEEIKEFKANPIPLKDKYLAYIKDTSISLDERWEVFVEAPIEWQEHDMSYPHFDAESLLKSREISWYDDFGIDKHETVYMVEVVEHSIEKSKDEDEENFTLEFVAALKAEVLEMNLGLFDYDW